MKLKKTSTQRTSKVGENDRSIGDNFIMTEIAQGVCSQAKGVICNPCICGRRFAIERGMKIHKTIDDSAAASCSGRPDGKPKPGSKPQCWGNPLWVTGRRILTAYQCLMPKAISQARVEDQRESPDIKMVLQLDKLIRKSTLEHKVATFADIMHGWETAGCSRHAGQSDFPRIVCRPIRLAWKNLRGFVAKKAQETCFVSPRRKAIFPMDSPLSQHKKRSLPSDIRYFPFALVNYSMTPTLTYFRPRWNSAANQRAQHCAGKGRRQSLNEYSGWRHTMACSYGIAVGLLV